MRTIQTFVLRLFIDRTEPGVLRGALRSVADAREWTFADVQALLALLRKLGAEIEVHKEQPELEPKQEGKPESGAAGVTREKQEP